MAKIPGKFERPVRVALFLALVVFLLYCTSRHVPWRDEYQTFLVATRTRSWAEFWTATRYERTPPLHYLIQRFLWPLASGALEPRTFIRVITLPFSILSLYLIFFRFRFPVLLALLLGLNVYFFREWGVISRSYAIGAALLLFSLDLRNRGKITAARIALALSAATHVLFFTVGGTLLALDFTADFRRARIRGRGARFWISFGAIGIALVGVALHAVPPPDTGFVDHATWPGLARAMGFALRMIAVVFVPIEAQFREGRAIWVWNWSEVRFGWSFILAIPLALAFRRDRALLGKFAVASLPVLGIFVFAYGPALRHSGVLFALFVYFLAQTKPDRAGRFSALVLAAGPCAAALYWLAAWNPLVPKFDFSDSPNVAPLLRTAGKAYLTRDFLLFPAMAESGREIYDVGRGRVAAYPYFRGPPPAKSIADFCRERGTYPLRAGDLFFVSLEYERGEERALENGCGKWERIYESNFRYATDEAFKVYRYAGADGG